ncbi:MAG: YegS/Rv2252/BmrU family lipid kinase [Candidatus Pelethousia sp.]|nr:YegS/Rv2252/BmrU family lipid kinase [Candidatus Pelethousia sp.]
MKKRLLLIMNPAAGVRKANRHLTAMVALFNAHGYICTVYCTAGRGDATRIAQENAACFDLVVCVGGDGTLNEVLAGVIDSGAQAPIGYIPGGSTNDFASSLGLSKEVLTAAQDIMEGLPRPLDAGCFNGRRFSYVASFGAFTEASYATPQSSKNILGHLAYVLEGMKDLPNIRPVPLALKAAGQHFEGEYIFGAISNATTIGGILSLDKQLVALDDGLFEITLIKSPQNLAELNRIVVSLQTRQYDGELISFCLANKAVAFANPNMPWTLDGEYAPGSAHICIENQHQAYRMIINDKKQGSFFL